MNVTEELLESEVQIDKAHVLRRIADWVSRIDLFYGNVADWCPAGWTNAILRTVPMHESLMQEFNVPATRLPVLRLTAQGRPDAIFEPRDLWIFGANGRIDLTFGDDHFIIIDQADNFERPDWQIASILKRRDRTPFNKAKLEDILR